MYEALFEQGVDRRGTSCVKWDTRESTFHNPEATPLSVADMDFHVPQEVVDAITARAAHGVFGYTVEMPGEKQAVVDWMRSRAIRSSSSRRCTGRSPRAWRAAAAGFAKTASGALKPAGKWTLTTWKKPFRRERARCYCAVRTTQSAASGAGRSSSAWCAWPRSTACS